MILERLILHVYPGKQAEHNALDIEWNAIESKLGFPPKKRWQLLAGADLMGTEVVERIWPSLAVMEETAMKAQADPAYQAINARNIELVQDHRWELYMDLEVK